MTFQEIKIIATGPCIANQLRDVNTICRRSWYIAAHVWKIYDFKIEVVPLIINFSTKCETKHTNLTLVNERQNNVTSCTNCPYLISTFIPLDVDKFGAVCFFYCFSTFCQLNVFFFKYALLV